MELVFWILSNPMLIQEGKLVIPEPSSNCETCIAKLGYGRIWSAFSDILDRGFVYARTESMIVEKIDGAGRCQAAKIEHITTSYK